MYRILLLNIVFILNSFSILQAQNQIFHVAQNAQGAGTGLNWADAFPDLQSAMQTAESGDAIWVASGTYLPTYDLDRTQTFNLPSGVQLLGGFAGIETSPEERDWTANPTVLSGDIGVINDSLDNSYTVITLSYPDSTTLVDGLIIRDGFAGYGGFDVFTLDPSKSGGGMYIMGVDGDAYPTIRNCRFEHNSAVGYGGGVAVNGGGDGSVAPLFQHCEFTNNRAQFDGGGLAYFGASWIERGIDIDSCRFEENFAKRYGGGLIYQDADRLDEFAIDGCTFLNNKSLDRAPGAYFRIGRVDGSYFSMTDCLFEKNKSLKVCNAVSIEPVGFDFLKRLIIDNCSFLENDTLTGSAISGAYTGILTISLFGEGSNVGSFTVKNCDFIRNLTKLNSTGRCLEVECPNIKNSTLQNLYFKDNTKRLAINVTFDSVEIHDIVSINNRRGINIAISKFNIQNFYYYSNDSTDGGFFLTTTADSYKLVNATIVNPFMISFEGSDNNNKISILNSCFIGPTSVKNLVKEFDTIAIENSYFLGISCDSFPYYNGSAVASCGTGVLTNLDPLFVNPDSGDYRLQPCSPLVNAGSNQYVMSPTDLAGAPRIQGGTVDIGAYETAAPTLAAPAETLPACPGGANGAIQAAYEGGCGPFTFAWANASGNTGNNLSQLPAGTYTVTVTDQRGSSLEFQVTVPTGDAPALTPWAVDITCGDTLGGAATAGLSGGLQPFHLLWDNGSTDTLRSGLPPGQYPVTVTDALGCTASGDVSVSATGALSIDIDVQEITCHGAADGAFTVLPANGKWPFGWLWSGGNTSPTLGPIGPGNYEGTLTDAFGCTVQWALPLTEPDPLLLEAEVTPATGPDQADGGITVQSIEGGTQPYGVLWSTGQTGWVCGPVIPGTYTATVTDANQCMLEQTYYIGDTGTGEASEGGIKLWPNPARELLHVAVENPAVQPLFVGLHDAHGRMLLRMDWPDGAAEAVLPLQLIPAGVYTLVVQGESGVYSERVVLKGDFRD